MKRPQTVVVTGGARGLGRGLVEAFLARGASVAFCGRTESSVAATLRELESFEARLLGSVADVARSRDVEELWAKATQRFGGVDVWINNAGTSNAQRPFAELALGDIDGVVQANLIGSMHGARVALAGMLAQGHGHIYNMEGFGSDGATQVGMTIYGSTKRAIRYFTRSLARETRGGPVKIGSLSPGIVVTDLLLDVYQRGDPALFRRKRWLFNLIADPVEVVAPWLAERVLAGPKHGEHIAWMTVPKAMLRAFNPAYHRRDLFGKTARATTR
jgi:NAD(P)-dependent dehydrogenase (short-subunit alcohol dehydrogenase family)